VCGGRACFDVAGGRVVGFGEIEVTIMLKFLPLLQRYRGAVAEKKKECTEIRVL